MKIIIETIPHDQQRYPTVGDWYYDQDGTLQIKVSDLGDWRYNFLIGLHELVEVAKCKQDGVTQEQVDKFDIAFEESRVEGDTSEPGDAPDAPYKKQHCLATGVERIMAAELDVTWSAYEGQINDLP